MKWIWRISAVLLGAALLCYGFVLFAFRQALSKADFPKTTPQMEAIKEHVEAMKRLALSGAFPVRNFDNSSVGSVAVEAELVDLRRDIEVFESMHGRLPLDFAELANVKFPPDWNRRLTRYAKECRMVMLSVDSCILNCDSWTPPNSGDLSSLVHSFDPRTGRFYKVQDHVLLYVPPPTMLPASPAKQKHQ
jgi:hypothetical protein